MLARALLDRRRGCYLCGGGVMTGILDPSRRGFLGMLLAVLAAFIGVAMAFGSMALAVHMIVAIPIVLVVARRAAEPEFGHRLMVVASWSVALWLARILLPAFTSSTLAVYAAMLPAIYASALFWWRALDCLIPASDAESAMPVRESALLRPEGIPGIQDVSFTPFPAAAAGKDEAAEPVAQAATDEPAAPEPFPWQGAKKRTCPSCWKTVEGDAAYCGSCGSPVATATMAAAPVAHAHAAPPVAPRTRMTVADVYAHHNRSPKPSTVVWDPALYRAPLGRRFLASLLDAIIAITLGFLASIVFGVGIGLLGDSAGADMELALGLGVLAGVLVLLLVTAGYFFTEALFGATAGKFLCGLRIARADGQPGNIGFWFARYWFKNLPNTLFIAAALSQSEMIGIMALVVLVLTVIGYLAVFGPSSQTFHDRASGTAVFMANDLQSGIADIVLARRLAGQLGGAKSGTLRNAYLVMGAIILLMIIGMRDSPFMHGVRDGFRTAQATSSNSSQDEAAQQLVATAMAEGLQPASTGSGAASQYRDHSPATSQRALSAEEQLTSIEQQLSRMNIPCDINTQTGQHIYYRVFSSSSMITDNGAGIVMLLCYSSHPKMSFRHLIGYHYVGGRWVFSGLSNNVLFYDDYPDAEPRDIPVTFRPPDIQP